MLQLACLPKHRPLPCHAKAILALVFNIRNELGPELEAAFEVGLVWQKMDQVGYAGDYAGTAYVNALAQQEDKPEDSVA